MTTKITIWIVEITNSFLQCRCNTYIAYRAGMKMELHTWNNGKVKCRVFYP